jgi:hypothetical protein
MIPCANVGTGGQSSSSLSGFVAPFNPTCAQAIIVLKGNGSMARTIVRASKPTAQKVPQSSPRRMPSPPWLTAWRRWWSF